MNGWSFVMMSVTVCSCFLFCWIVMPRRGPCCLCLRVVGPIVSLIWAVGGLKMVYTVLVGLGTRLFT